MSEHSTELQSTLNSATDGDVEAFRRLCALSLKDRDIFQRALAIAAQHFRLALPSPDQPSSPEITTIHWREEETLAAIAVRLISERARENNEEQDTILEFLYDNMKRVLDWIFHLYTTRVFNFEDADQHDVAESPERFRSSQEGLTSTVPHLIAMMSEQARLCHAMKEDTRVGILLSLFVIFSVRNRMPSVARLGAKARDSLASVEHGVTQNWESAFFQSLESNVAAFTDAFIPRMYEYTRPKPNGKLLRSGILQDLVYCIKNSDVLLEACLERAMFTRYMTYLFCSMTGYVITGDPDLSRKDAYIAITYIADFMDSTIKYGGQYFLYIILQGQFLDTIVEMRKHISLNDLNCFESARAMEKSLVSLLTTSILYRVVYPGILGSAESFIELFETHSVARRPSNLPNLDKALLMLKKRIDEEKAITAWITQDYVADPNYPHPFKFCDNYLCPLKGKYKKLGRCSACGRGYYCSRTCQKVLWKSGHRNECKKVAAAVKDNLGGIEFGIASSIHDTEYLRRTTISHIRYYAAIYEGNRPHSGPLDYNEDTIVDLDFTAYPVTLRKHSDSEEALKEGFEPALGRLKDEGLKGPGIRATYPSCRKLDPQEVVRFCLLAGGATRRV